MKNRSSLLLTDCELIKNLYNIIHSAKESLLDCEGMGVIQPVIPKYCNSEKNVFSEAEAADSFEQLKSSVSGCVRCRLWKSRTNVVFGEGNPSARLMFIGEGPGKDEDEQGRPFVGESGKLLTRIIEKGMGLKREDVYICNVIKCRPPANRDPKNEEVASCMEYLIKQIELVSPEMICILGSVAGRALMGRDFKITSERGQWLSFRGIPAIATFHPSYILRNPDQERQNKAKVWEDIKIIMKHLNISGAADA